MEHRTISQPAPFRTASTGGRVPTERRNIPWPFKPDEPKPRPLTARQKAKRSIAFAYGALVASVFLFWMATAATVCCLTLAALLHLVGVL